MIRKVYAAEGHPGVLDTVAGAEFHLFGVHAERTLRGLPGQIIATRDGAICRATIDGAVWLTHLKAPGQFKLPATRALELAGCELDVPEVPVALHAPIPAGHTYREISYEERAGVGYLNFNFYNGAMSTEQCRRLREAYLYARSRKTKVIVLAGGADFFSNGIHLNVIEAAEDPGEESWYNLHAIDDVVREIVETDSHLVISALSGDAAAGGVPFAVAADHVVAREDVVLNPYYQHMGGLYGSEYWTYLLPRRVGHELTAELTGAPFNPIGTRRAVEIGLIDAAFGDSAASFRKQVRGLAERLARHPDMGHWLEEKRSRRTRDEQLKPLSAYRTEELAKSHECFFGGRPQLPRGTPALRAQAGRPLRRPRPAAPRGASPSAQPSSAPPGAQADERARRGGRRRSAQRLARGLRARGAPRPDRLARGSLARAQARAASGPTAARARAAPPPPRHRDPALVARSRPLRLRAAHAPPPGERRRVGQLDRRCPASARAWTAST